MAPWSSRASPGDSHQEKAAPTTSLPLMRAETRDSSGQLSERVEHSYSIPTLHHPGRTSPLAQRQPSGSPNRPLSRGRSMSHSFPSLFNNKKKAEQGGVPVAGSSTFDNGEPAAQGGSTGKAHSSKKYTVSEKDLTTGKCMTCNSTVRWPKELYVFRCTICLMINDLSRGDSDVRSGNGRWKSRYVSREQSQLTPKASITSEKTKCIIDRCLSDFLEYLLSENGSGYLGVELSPRNQVPKAKPQEHKKSHVAMTNSIERNDVTNFEEAHEIYYRNNRLGNDYETANVDEDLGLLPSRSIASPQNFASQMRIPSRDLDDDFYLRVPDRSPQQPPSFDTLKSRPSPQPARAEDLRRKELARKVFKPLEDYVISCFGSHDCINSSFVTEKHYSGERGVVKLETVRQEGAKVDETFSENPRLSELDAKLLLIGDFAENGSWWTGSQDDQLISNQPRASKADRDVKTLVDIKSPRIDWFELNDWYHKVTWVGSDWQQKLTNMHTFKGHKLKSRQLSTLEIEDIDSILSEARNHIQRALLKASENLLKRPGLPLNEPEDIRFLLILLANPLLNTSRSHGIKEQSRSASRSRETHNAESGSMSKGPNNAHNLQTTKPLAGPGHHSTILKRVVGLMSNLSNECHHHLVKWFGKLSESHFRRIVDLVGSFITYRLIRQQGKVKDPSHDPIEGLVPSISGPSATSAAFHAALGTPERRSRPRDNQKNTLEYAEDWQIKAAARVMALLFSANSVGINRRTDFHLTISPEPAIDASEKSRFQRHLLSTSDFYNTLLDYSNLIADFVSWETRRSKFSFCQYPFLLSIWAKIQILEYDAKRQMEVKAREAFFNSIMTRKAVNQYLSLSIRRDCLVEDSLKGVSEVVGAGGEEIKKSLRIEFKGEEGIDAGGLRKEWFLLLVRDVFNPEHGMFVYDDDSQFCYFNPYSFETSDQFFLVGVVLGLAIYNSTILDIALPPFCFRKLMASVPGATTAAVSHAKPVMTYSLEDLAEFRPSLARGLRQLLDYKGDVEELFCRDFVADVERYGQVIQIPLCPNGASIPVTNTNRREFVDFYVRYLLDTAVSRQFEPFKRGFFSVCGGNALSLFQPEEIELLIRGSDEPLDISSLRAVAVYENWGVSDPAESEPAVNWFWQTFANASVINQRKLLGFITGSDRIPAMGATSLVIKLSCLGDESSRFPVARTCFNTLSLWRYNSQQKLENLLWRAVDESEGFGLR